jgi:hypothetical protein
MKNSNDDYTSRRYRSEDFGIRGTCIPQCNGCKNWNGPNKCKIVGSVPREIAIGEKRGCTNFEFDANSIASNRYAELYPEEVQRGKR